MPTLLASNAFRFTLVLDGVDEHTPDLEDALYEAGCDDALIIFSSGTIHLDFEIVSDDIESDIINAVCKVECAGIGAIVQSVTPAPYVSLSDIAKRLKKTRQGISLLATGKRGDGSFPKPLFNVGNKSPLWRWSAVLEWAIQQQAVDSDMLVTAKVIEDINAALDARNLSAYRHRAELYNRLEKNFRKH